jgi:DNA adenine methylase
MKPIIRWAGSKRQLLPQLKELVPHSYARYIEPFFGSGCLYFDLLPKIAVVSDINSQLIAVYQAVAKSPREVACYLESIPHSQEAYYQLRSLDPTALDESAKAARFIFLMKSCFNGVYRTNKSGTFNTPFSGSVYRLPVESELLEMARVFEACSIQNCDFSVSLNDAQSGDFVYLDPPYPAAKFRGEYGYNQFTKEDMSRLLHDTKKASARGVKVMLSFCESDWLNGQLNQWNKNVVSVRRTVSATLMNRKTINELVITNYHPCGALV